MDNTHSVEVKWSENNHGYPYRAACECGWRSRGYVSRDAAQIMGDDHAAQPFAVNV